MTKEQEELRNHFAGLAMAALLPGAPSATVLAKKAYKYADAMLKESESKQP